MSVKKKPVSDLMVVAVAVGMGIAAWLTFMSVMAFQIVAKSSVDVKFVGVLIMNVVAILMVMLVIASIAYFKLMDAAADLVIKTEDSIEELKKLTQIMTIAFEEKLAKKENLLEKEKSDTLAKPL